MPYTIQHLVCYEEEIKKSRFQAVALPVENEEQIKNFLVTYKDSSATHQCWAWKLGHQIRLNDDGEPSGTAGRPILAVIEGHDLTHILVIVNRWFGGVKLGTGGLVRAYGGCASECLARADKIELVEKKYISFFCYFNEWPVLRYDLEKEQIDYSETYTATGVLVEASLNIEMIEILGKKLQDVTRGREQIKMTRHDP